MAFTLVPKHLHHTSILGNTRHLVATAIHFWEASTSCWPKWQAPWEDGWEHLHYAVNSRWPCSAYLYCGKDLGKQKFIRVRSTYPLNLTFGCLKQHSAKTFTHFTTTVKWVCIILCFLRLLGSRNSFTGWNDSGMRRGNSKLLGRKNSVYERVQ